MLMRAIDAKHDSKTRILEAAVHVFRAKGYSAARIEDICETAGLTKGSFFHHFEGKEDLALSATEYWRITTSDFFASAPYHASADPVERLLAYVDFRKAGIQGELSEFTCLLGTIVQEVYKTHPNLRDACNVAFGAHVATFEADIAEAIRACGVVGCSAESLSLHIQAVIQGAFILAKAKQSPEVAVACLDHLRRYLELLFVRPRRKAQADFDSKRRKKGRSKNGRGGATRDHAAPRSLGGAERKKGARS
jgi:TetR/AcrR family transcriptional repressor of nem operon